MVELWLYNSFFFLMGAIVGVVLSRRPGRLEFSDIVIPLLIGFIGGLLVTLIEVSFS